MVVAQLVRASDCDSEGRRFEPGHPPHNYFVLYLYFIFANIILILCRIPMIINADWNNIMDQQVTLLLQNIGRGLLKLCLAAVIMKLMQ